MEASVAIQTLPGVQDEDEPFRVYRMRMNCAGSLTR